MPKLIQWKDNSPQEFDLLCDHWKISTQASVVYRAPISKEFLNKWKCLLTIYGISTLETEFCSKCDKADSQINQWWSSMLVDLVDYGT